MLLLFFFGERGIPIRFYHRDKPTPQFLSCNSPTLNAGVIPTYDTMKSWCIPILFACNFKKQDMA